MSDSKLPPRYVGYPRAGASVPDGGVARLVALARCQRAFVLVQGAIVTFVILRLFELWASSPLIRGLDAVVEVFYGAAIYVVFGLFAPLMRWRRGLGLIPAGLVFLSVLMILSNPAHYAVANLAVLIGIANIIGLPAVRFLAGEMKRNGFTSRRALLNEIRRLQSLERKTYVPPIPENLYSGEPPKPMA